MIAKDIDKITEKDLLDLVENSVMEWRTIEYKEYLESNSDSDKKEFLADVSSFANAMGGDIIYGISQDKETGSPKQLMGVDIKNIDQEILRLESMIRDGIEPRISSVRFGKVELSHSRIALIIRIGKSWIGPHRVSFKSYDRFFSRGSNGKYRLDMAELRTAFALSETITRKIKEFRVDRISRICSNETPVPFYDNAKIVLHLVPLISFSPAQNYEISRIALHPETMPPIYCAGSNHRYNFDGFLTYCGGEQSKSHSYVQLFRNGIIECVEGLILKPRDENLLIPSVSYEVELVKSLHDYLSILKALDVELPILLFLTMVGVKGYAMAIGVVFGRGSSTRIDRDILFLPEVLIESYDVVEPKILKPCFDSVWNACGLSRSLNYDESGNWQPH
jgi:hypothetical protein